VTEKDAEDLKFGLALGVDMVALSFVQTPEDCLTARQIMRSVNADVPLIAKIERPQALEHLDAILAASDGVMVARGDLGTELNRSRIGTIQRQIIRVAHSFLKPVLVATEVYGSMGKYPKDAWQPNRGEVLDLRHALEAGVDGIVFSAETGARDDPQTTVLFAVMQAKIDQKDIEQVDLHKAERDKRRERMEFGYDTLLGHKTRTPIPEEPLNWLTLRDFSTMDWACAAVYRANIRRAAGIFPFTVQGNTVRDMVHFLPYRPGSARQACTVCSRGRTGTG
jgi:pyruvate kinase